MRMPERPRIDEAESTRDNGLNFKGLIVIFCISAIVMFCVVFFFLTAFDDEQEKVSAPVVSQEKVSRVAPPVVETKEVTPEPQIFYGVGEYKVGVDLPADEYLAVGTGYIVLRKDSTGKIGTIILNDNFTDTQRYIEVRDGEYLAVSGDLRLYHEKDAPKINTQEKVPAGQYKVGIDIPPGEYKVNCEDNGYIAVSKTSRGDIVTNRVVSSASSVYITVSDGQYLKIVRGEANLVSKGR